MSQTITYTDGSTWEKLVRDDTKIGSSNGKVTNWPTFDVGLQTQANTTDVYRSFDNYPNAFAISNKEGTVLFGFFPDNKVEYNLQENIPLNSEDLYASISKKVVNPILGFGKKSTVYTYSKSDGETYVETCTDDDHCTSSGDSNMGSRKKSPLKSPLSTPPKGPKMPSPSGVAARLFGGPSPPATAKAPGGFSSGNPAFVNPAFVNPAFVNPAFRKNPTGGYRKRSTRKQSKRSRSKQTRGKHARK
jgi:hypothetical protein